jgi:hypothetical protein
VAVTTVVVGAGVRRRRVVVVVVATGRLTTGWLDTGAGRPGGVPTGLLGA